MLMSGPIKPKEVEQKKEATIPEPVFEAFNEMIVQKWRGSCAEFYLKEVADLAFKKLKDTDEYKDITRQAMYDRGWMDVEPAYRKAGWQVKFDKPGYNESYEAFFVFSTERK